MEMEQYQIKEHQGKLIDNATTFVDRFDIVRKFFLTNDH